MRISVYAANDSFIQTEQTERAEEVFRFDRGGTVLFKRGSRSLADVEAFLSEAQQYVRRLIHNEHDLIESQDDVLQGLSVG
jgi:hypothetical protein